MLEETDRLTRLIENLLMLTRAETGRFTSKRETVDLNALVVSVVEKLRVLAEEKEQNLQFKCGAFFSIQCDPAVLQQAVINLLHNAIKYTPNKGTIQLRIRSVAANEVAIEIEDTGLGIPVSDRERIFERFYRVDSGRSRDTGGVGLGLAIGRWAAEANGGRIELDSEEHRGSIFRIILPTTS